MRSVQISSLTHSRALIHESSCLVCQPKYVGTPRYVVVDLTNRGAPTCEGTWSLFLWLAIDFSVLDCTVCLQYEHLSGCDNGIVVLAFAFSFVAAQEGIYFSFSVLLLFSLLLRCSLTTCDGSFDVLCCWQKRKRAIPRASPPAPPTRKKTRLATLEVWLMLGYQ